MSGYSRRKQYPNGDIVYNNSVLYLIDRYSGDLKWDEESKMLKFFDIDNLPSSQYDEDLVNAYIQSTKN